MILSTGFRTAAAKWIAGICLIFIAGSANADFTPAHPYIYLDAQQVQIMKDNVKTHKYSWATNLYNQAKASAKTGSWNFNTYQLGKNMMGCALVYLIDGDTSYADGAVYWLNQCRLNYDPQDQDLTGTITLEKWYHFQPNQVLIPIVYDLIYNYMASNRPSDLTNLTAYIEWIGGRMVGSFDHNENHQNHYGRALCGYALGKESWITEVEDDFKSWYNGGTDDVQDGFHYEVGAQAMKHFAYVFESQVHYALAAHNAVRKGYRSWDPATWTNSGGFNLIQDNWRMLIKKSTPKFQVPFESMWRGNHYLTPTCSGFHNIAHVMTSNTEWQAVAAAGPARTVIPHHTVNTDWAGLAHGRQISGTPRITNDCVRNREIGFAVLNSGTPSGVIDPTHALHAYLMCGDYGETPPMNLILYGKGKMLNTAIMDVVVDSWGERASGGSVVDLFIDADIAVTPTEHVWSVSNSTIKIMAYEEYGQHRAVAVTKDYFADVYDVTKSGATSLTWDFQGIGPSNTALSRAAGTFSGDFTCTWPDHMKTYVINDGSSTVSLTADNRMPYSIDSTVGPEYANVSQRQVNPIYTTEYVRKLRVRRTVTGNTRFISVVEPLGQGSVLTSVQRFNTNNTAAVTGLKIITPSYTDYYFYNNTTGTYTLVRGSESVTVQGRWGFIRSEGGTASVHGGITAYTLTGVTGGVTQVQMPSISPTGGTFSASVTISLSTVPSDASIYYTINGATPSAASTLYSGPFALTNSATVKAIGIKGGLSNSPVASASFTVTNLVPPSAGFTLSPSAGTAPLAVTFTDISTGSITNRFWSFGDGATSNTLLTSLQHTYSATGTMTVELTVRGPGGASTNRLEGCISVTAPAGPSAGFTWTPSSGTVPLTVTFTDTSTGSITNRIWNFGDGVTTSTTLTSLQHTYTQTGAKTVSLIVSGPDGANTNVQAGCISVSAASTNAASTNITAHVNDQQRRSDGTAQAVNVATARVGTEASGVSSGLTVPFWIPDLGGLQIINAELSVTLPSDAGLSMATGSANVDLYGVRANPTNSLTVSTDYTSGSLLADNMFSIVSNLPIGEKTVSDPALTAWINAQAVSGGTYVFLTLRPDAITGSYRYATLNTANATNDQPVLRLWLGTPPSADFTLSPSSGTAPLTVTFTDTSTGDITNRFWSFGDGNTTNTALTSVQHTYTTAGSRTVQLVVSGPGGASTNVQTDCISVTAASTNGSSMSITAHTDDQHRRSDGTSQLVNSTTARIGTEATGVNSGLVLPFWVPDLNGQQVINAELSVTLPSNAGLTYAIGVANADVYGVRSNPTNSLTDVTDYSTGTLLADNMFSIVSNLPISEKTVSDPALTAWINAQAVSGGTYVFLTVRPDATASSYRYATLNTANATNDQPVLRLWFGAPPSASFTLMPSSGTTPLTVTFTDTSTGDITSRTWNFGDGNTTNTALTSVQHTYTAAGSKTVSLLVSGPDGISTNVQAGCINVTDPVQTNITAHTDDQQRRSDGTSQLANSTTARIGTESAGVNSGLVLPFWIPDLGGQQIINAELSVTIPTNSGLTYAIGAANADVYGVRSNPTNSLTDATDYSAGTLLADNMFTIVSNLPIGEKTISDSALTTWINAQAVSGGTYVFLTVRPDATASASRFATINTANATNDQPVLRLWLGQ
jgi:PKD repeat protein